MPHSELQNIIIEFLKEFSPEGEDGNRVIENDGDFSIALSAMWAERAVESHEKKKHFAELDDAYGAKVLDVFQKSANDTSHEEHITSLMKAALDDVNEHRPDALALGDMQFVSDEVILEFLSEEE